MFLTFLSRFMSSVVTTLLFISIVGFTASQTLLSTQYIETKLESQNAYSRLSDSLSSQIAHDSQDGVTVAVPQDATAAQLKTILTPAVLQQKIETTLQQLQAYYNGKGPVPTLDISDLVKQAQQAGLPAPKDEKFQHPVVLTTTTKAKKVSDVAKVVSIGTLVAVVMLLLGIFAIAFKRKNYKPFANIIFSLGLMLTITGIALLFVPRVFNKLYHFDPVKNPFGTLAHDLGVIAVHDFGLRLLIPGATILLLGIIAKVALRGTRTKDPAAVKSSKSSLDYAKASDTPLAPIDSAQEAIPPTSLPTSPQKPTPGAPPRPKKPRKIQL